MIHEKEPKNFNPVYEVVACFLERDKKILLLHRQDNKSEGNKWGLPAGKVDDGEDIFEAIVREIKEETGLNISKENISHFKKIYVRYPEYDFIYHMFHTNLEDLDKTPKVIINLKEHKDFRWAEIERASEIPLVLDLLECINLFYKKC